MCNVVLESFGHVSATGTEDLGLNPIETRGGFL
jgi:hypothetical protein